MNVVDPDRADIPVLVTGATGSTGGAVARELLRRGVAVRAMVRRPQALAEWSAQGVEVVVGDFDDGEAVAAALQGARSAFLVTPSSEHAEDQQLRFVEVAAAASVQHLVVLSQLGARVDSPVRFLRYHAVVEDRVRELGLGHTMLRPNLFFQGLLAFAGSISADGSMAGPIGDARVSAVDVRDIGAVGGAVLADGSHLGEELTITGPEPISHPEMARQIGEALGKPVTFSRVSGTDFVTALAGVLPDWQLHGLIEDYAHYDRGEASDVTSVVPDVTGKPARSFGDFARDHAEAFR